jgi:CRISPR system Cascade subunit CasE
MYLSRLILNPRSRRVQQEVAHPYEMHRSVMRAFPNELAEESERVLFRLEPHPRTGALVLLVQSSILPDWSWITDAGARGYLLPADEPNPAVKSFDLTLVPGQTLAFRLRANPTVKRSVNRENNPYPENKSKRVGLYREEEQLAWLARKAAESGFRVLSARTSQKDVVGGSIHRGEATHNLRLLGVQFDGLLQVTDPGRLCESVARGIGSGKGLGFGLLSLARPA